MTAHGEHLPNTVNNEQAAKLEELVQQATDLFGENATFAYPKDNVVYTLTLTEALQVCGEHIVRVPLETALGVLQRMRVVAPPEDARPELKQMFNDSLARGRALLARRALREE